MSFSIHDFRYPFHDIRFCDAEDLTTICRYTVGQHEPGILCAGTQSTLLYEDASKSPREVHWLDLSDREPKPAKGKCVIHTKNKYIYDMCFVQDGDKQLLIVAGGDEGFFTSKTTKGPSLFAYDTEKDKLEWKVGENLPGNKEHMRAAGVTTDGRGHLFVTDRNNDRIQMFYVSDGAYLGHLILDTEILRFRGFLPWRQILPPCGILWCEKMSSLVYTSGFNREWYFMVINVEY